MSDLISRKALIAKFEEHKLKTGKMHELFFFDAVIAIIDNQPTAYDVDDIANKLKTDTGVWNDGFFEYITLYQAIAIVKGAVKDE